MTRAPRRAVVAMIVTATLAVAGCSGTTDGSGRRASASGSATPTGSTASRAAPSSGTTATLDPSSGRDVCPSSYAAPDPRRPKVALDFTIASGHRTVTGTEKISFTPDRPVTELVFRLTANTKPSVRQGNGIRVTSASASPAGGRYTFTSANAASSTQGGLLRIPLGRTVAAGGTATATIAFTLTLGRDSFDRFGTAGAFAYFGSGQPLLAWERGYGWHTEDMIDFTAESATSEAMDTDLRVTAPAKDVVIASGDPATPAGAGGTTRTWTSHLDAARDVSVAAGPFVVSDTVVTAAGRTTKLRLGAADKQTRDAMVPEFHRAIRELASRYGPFPFPSLSVAQLPTGGGGIEYPGSILMLDASREVAVHETAHQWFYAMVGDSQSRHPWLDEAFAQYSEELVDDAPGHRDDLGAPGDVDSSVQSYGIDESGYYFTTYNKGSAALEAARRAAGSARWDAAIRCYVAANAWRIANPSDLRSAIAKLPAAVKVLEQAGALKR